MELSKEVHGLLERIKKLSQQAQKNESYSNMPINVSLNLSHKNFNSPMSIQHEVSIKTEDLIPVENMDFSDCERWLHVSENSMVNPYTGDLTEWLHQDFNNDNSITQFLELESKLDSRKFIDTRTFTRPKKRISRPSLEQFTDGYFSQSNSKFSDSFHRDSMKSSISEDVSSDSYQESSYSGPVHFKLSEPVYNTSFERILATANESIDSFTNMSPPSLVNSLCSSTFTTLMDSGYVNQDLVPNDKESSLVLNENNDPNVTYIADHDKSNKSLNDTYDIKIHNKTELNTFSKINENDLNSTFQKNISNKADSPRYNLSNTSTFTKKPKGLTSNLTKSFKASCPDINRTFQKAHDCSLDLTFQKLSDSQPNLTEDLKRTILNQSMELMNPTGDVYHSARSGSADSLDERSSSISNSSKDSGTKILNMGELDVLAKVQEQRLQQAMSTPNKPVKRFHLMEGDVLSPIQSRNVDEGDGYLSRSDSDLSDSCVTARSGLSKCSSSARSIGGSDIAQLVYSEANVVTKPEVRHLPTTVPTMMVKPMEVNRTMVHPTRAQSAPGSCLLRPKIRTSGLPRPTLTTGIPRPMSRIPGPKSHRPPTSRPIQRQPSKTDWMDGCY